tara:strand:- start:6483 stop:6761 length:279 start_codon:yes stop_codon:yes gene_type:complete
MNTKEMFFCDCHDLEHHFIVSTWDEVDDDLLEIYVRLRNDFPWYKRVWFAIKYIFGTDSANFTVVLLDIENAQRLAETLEDFVDKRAGGSKD